MKKLFFVLLAAATFSVSCKKTENTTAETVKSDSENKEVALEQQVKIFKNSKGDQLKVSYFAEGDMVAVKIQKNDEPEHKLSAKTVNAKGNPLFTDNTYMWEMNDSGTGGKLSDKDGNSMEYREDEAPAKQ